MKNQLNMVDLEYAGRKRTARKEVFLRKMDELIPWSMLTSLVAPYYPSGKRGRPVRGIETMLRMYFMKQWFGLSDVGIEDAIYDSYAMKCFLDMDFSTEQVPDATTLLRFRHLLDKNNLTDQINSLAENTLYEKGYVVHTGKTVDATLTPAPKHRKKPKKADK